MKSMLKIALVSTALVIAGSAQADPIIYAPGTTASASPWGSGGIGTLTVTNGSISTSTPAAGVAFSSSGTPDGFNSGVVGTTDVGTTASASAHLSEGAVHGFGSVGSPSGPIAIFSAEAMDTLFFNNTSGGVVNLNFTYAFDGQINPTGTFASQVYSSLNFYGKTGCDALYAACSDFMYLASGAGASNTTVIGYSSYLPSFNGIQQGGAFVWGAADSVDLSSYSVFKDWDDATGIRTTIISSTLALPVGLSHLGYRLRIAGDCRFAGAYCDFGNTSKFGFGAIPTGLTVTSASGVFPTGVTAGVPEPATWAMMLAGFGLVGAAIRQRRRVAAQVA